MFSWRNKKNIKNFWLKNLVYYLVQWVWTGINFPVSILHKSLAGHLQACQGSWRANNGPLWFIKNTSWEAIGLDKMLFSIKNYWIFSYFLMNTHNICFCGEIRKLFTWCPLLSRPMSKGIWILIGQIWYIKWSTWCDFYLPFVPIAQSFSYEVYSFIDNDICINIK